MSATSKSPAVKPAYIVAEVEIHDLAGFKSYAEQFAGTLAPFGGKLLSFGESIVPIEGIEENDGPRRHRRFFPPRKPVGIGLRLRFTERLHPSVRSRRTPALFLSKDFPHPLSH